MARKLKGQGQILSGSPSSNFTNFSPKPIQANRAPTTADTGYEIGQLWADTNGTTMYGLSAVSGGSATWNLLGPGASDVDTLTGDTGGAVSPTGGNINIVGGDGLTVAGAGSTLTINRDAAGGYPITPYVVGSAGEAGYTTIQSAISAASAAGGGSVWIQQGSYTEDLVLADQVYLMAVCGISQGPNEGVQIIGTHTPPTSGHVQANGIYFQSTTDIFASAAAGTAHIQTANCEFAVQNGYEFDLPNWTGIIEIYDCNPGPPAAPFAINDGGINNTGGAEVIVYNSGVGNGTNVMTISGSAFFGQAVTVGCPLTCATGTDLDSVGSQYVAAVTWANNSTVVSTNDSYLTGAAAAITMNSSAACTLSNCVIDSTNNPAIDGTGAGTLSVGTCSFLNNTSLAGTLTVAYDQTITGGVTSTGNSLFNGGTFTVGSDNAANAIDIGGGTTARTIDIGSSAAAHVITIGSVTGAAQLDLLAGTGNFSVTGAATTSMTIGTGLTSGTITIGATGNTGTMTISPSTGAQQVDIANADGAKTINVGAGVDGNTISIGNGVNTSAQTVNISNGASAADTTVNIMSGVGTAGAGTLAIGNNTRVTTVGLADIAPAAARTVTICGGDSAQNDTLSIMSDNPSANAQTVTILGGVPTGGTQTLNLLTQTGQAGTVNVGTGAAMANTLNIGGTGANTIAIGNTQTGGSVAIGDAMTTGTIDIGGSGAQTGTITIAGGTGAQTLNIANSTGGKTVTIASGAGANTVTVGSTNTTSTTTINAGSGGVQVAGDVDLTTGSLQIEGAGQRLAVEGGAATDFIGQATLVAGTVTVANTNIAAADKVFVTREGVAASTALGVLDVSISAATSFTITALQPGTPGSTETNDVSIVNYFIVRQL